MTFFKKLDQKLRGLNHKRIDIFRKWRVQLCLLLFNQKNQTGPSNLKKHEQKNKSVLVLRLDGKLGDTITLTGFLHQLERQNYEIDIITKKENAFIYEFISAKLSVFCLKKGLLSFFRLWFKLRNRSYDYLICTTHIIDPKSLFFSRFLHATHKIIYLNSQMRFFDSHIEKDFYSSHVTERYRKILDLMDLPHNADSEDSSFDLSYKLAIPDQARAEAKLQLEQENILRKKVVVLNSFAGAKLRNFSEKTTITLIKKLIDLNFFVVSIGNVGDLNILKDWQSRYQNEFWCVMKRGDFAFNAAIVSLADLVITPDTAIVHLAGALNRPLLAVYRSDLEQNIEKNAVMWAPYYTEKNKNGHKVIYAHHENVNNVDLDQIIESAKLLTASPAHNEG